MNAIEKVESNEGLLVEILTCLPVESIFRFMCVSKRWEKIIKTPFFLQSYSRRRCSDGGRLLALFQRSVNPRHNNEDLIDLACNHPTNMLTINRTSWGDRIHTTPRQFGRFITSSNAEWEGGEMIGCVVLALQASSWLYMVPWGLWKLLSYISLRYNNPPLYITENGMDDENDPTAPFHEMLDDELRVSYYKGYVAAVHQAIDDGVDVRGYFAWSLLDNFEWHLGYTKRFGLIYVDYKNGLTRHLKSSAYWFSRFLKEEGDKSGKLD